MLRFIVSVGLILMWACTARESGKGLNESPGGPVVDSMPIIEPEVPESANVILPEVQDTMPVAEPESLETPK